MAACTCTSDTTVSARAADTARLAVVVLPILPFTNRTFHMPEAQRVRAEPFGLLRKP